MNQREALRKLSGELLHRISRSIASSLALVLLITALASPAQAKWLDQSGSLPGTVSNGEIIGIAAAGAAIVGLVVYFSVFRKGTPALKLETKSIRFDDLTPGEPNKKTVPVTNRMQAQVTVKEVSVEDKSGNVTVSGRQCPFTLAPGERFDVQLTVAAGKDSGKARLRLVCSAPKSKKDRLQYIAVSYGHQKSKASKLVPHI